MEYDPKKRKSFRTIGKYGTGQMRNRERKKFRLEYWQLMMIFLICYDLLAIHAAYFLALWLRFDFLFSHLPEEYIKPYSSFITLYALGCIPVFWLFRLYRGMWRLAGLNELMKVFEASFLTSIAHAVLITVLYHRMPITYYVIGAVFQFIFVALLRFLPRLLSYERARHRSNADETTDRVMLIGAGAAGQMLLHDMLGNNEAHAKIVCVIDDNPNKWNRDLEGVPIVGGRDDILANVEKYHVNKIFFAIPSASAEQKRDILNICSETDCELRQLPGMYQFVLGQVSLSAMREVSVEDLLGRAPIQTDMKEVFQFINGKSVLVTGGGGSIGSELCRQIAARSPKRLIILDIYENNAYDIQQELHRTYGSELDMQVVIASVRDKDRIYALFDELRPDIVFHAAAHKHVPLMESCPTEAIKNNIFGTYHVVRAAEKYGIKKFVMISTDKAVNPTNVMGATKRFCEMILQSRVSSPTEYCAVRFGNVLGSNGSVVPLFKKQIEEGGPVTVTDKRIIRYFMTIPEAAQLVLEAGAIAKQSQIFVLDMGEPVKILDLAEKLIRLSGYEPYKEIEIKEIGLRPGEKLYEELLMSSETLSKTENKKIFVEQQQEIDPEQIMENLETLDHAVTNGDLSDQELITMLKRMIPTYHAPEEVNRKAVTVLKT